MIGFAQEQTKSETYEIYEKLINDGTPNVIYKYTVNPNLGEFLDDSNCSESLKRELSFAQPETLTDFYSKNEKAVEIPLISTYNPLYQLDDGEINPYFESLKINAEQTVRKFTEKYKTSSFDVFSAIGFNKTQNQAMLTRRDYVDLVNNWIVVIILSKERSRWIIKHRFSIRPSEKCTIFRDGAYLN